MKPILLSGLGLIALVLAGCAKAPAPAPADRPVRIGLSMDSFVVERWIRDRDIFVAEAEALGATVLVQVANQDHETQVAQIKALSGQGIDVLVVVPNDSTRLGPTVQEVRNRGIPVISYDRLILNGKADLYIAHDHVAAGALMAAAVATAARNKRASGPFQVIIVNGARPDHNSALMNQGFHQALDPVVQSRQAAIVREVWLNSWSSEEAETAFRAVLDETKTRPDAVIASNDMLAESLIRVLSQRRWLDGTFVTGMDADLAACQRVIEGTQSMTVYKPIAPLAMAAARYAVKLARHESLDIKEFINDGEFNIPYVKLLPVAVDRSNMREVIVKDGFHRAEEIYRNPAKN
jgi:D-xylose transport system substrate-binding protein